MRKIKEILRLKFELKLSNRQIAKSCHLSRATVADYTARVQAAGLNWPLPPEMDETALENLLFPSANPLALKEPKFLPDWALVHQELKRKGVTLLLLWTDYKEQSPDGYQYSWFCQLYQAWAKKLDLSMRQEHLAGEKMFVDYAGQTLGIIDRATGAVHEAQIFIAVMGASNYTYVEASRSQTLPDWIQSHTRALAFFGGVPEILVPDNLKSGVRKACFYEPDLNPTYRDLAEHYGCAIIPARVRRPKDKAKVEVGVQIVERWILARLRHHTFFSLEELNHRIREMLPSLNQRPFKKLPGNRETRFRDLDKPALKPLPDKPYEYAEWKKVQVHIDYHVEVERRYYSVPYQLVKKRLEARWTRHTVEVFHKGKRVASHIRLQGERQYSTLKEHMPQNHQAYLSWTPERFVNWAHKCGPETARAIASILKSKLHPQQGFRACLGVMRLEGEYGKDRLEAACKRALEIGSPTRKSIKAILSAGLDQRPMQQNLFGEAPCSEHENIRGPEYYDSIIKSQEENPYAASSHA
jgi:transposase